MAQKPIEFKTPVKGVIKDLAFSDIKPDVALDALNVMPFDRQGRMRANQRAGYIQVSTQPSLAVALRTSPLYADNHRSGPSTVTADQLNFNEPFTYANGNLGTLNANWFCSTAVSNSIKTNFNAASLVSP